MKPLIQFHTCTGSALNRIHSIQRVEDFMPALHATTLKNHLNEHYSYLSKLQGLNAYLFLGHFPVKKKLKISITFCPVETSSVRHARIHNLCCQQLLHGVKRIGVHSNARTPLLKFRSHMCFFLFHLVVTRDHGKLECVFNVRFFLQFLGAINDSKLMVIYYQRIPKPTTPFRNVFQSKYSSFTRN